MFRGKNALAAPNQQVVILYWEDVVMPTRWMTTHLGLDASAQSFDNAVRAVKASTELQGALAAIETRVLELIAQAIAVTRGLPVCIVAEAPTAYVEAFSARFFPRLTAALRTATDGIFVVGPPDTQLTAEQIVEWKKTTIYDVCVERLPMVLKASDEKPIGFIVLCVPPADEWLPPWIRHVIDYAVLKTAFVGTTTEVSLETFYSRLKTLAEFVKAAGESTTAMTARV